MLFTSMSMWIQNYCQTPGTMNQPVFYTPRTNTILCINYTFKKCCCVLLKIVFFTELWTSFTLKEKRKNITDFPLTISSKEVSKL